MAAKLIWSIEAVDDLDAIAQYIHRDSPLHAQRVVDAALELAESIAEQPLAGRMVPELRDAAIRERFLYRTISKSSMSRVCGQHADASKAHDAGRSRRYEPGSALPRVPVLAQTLRDAVLRANSCVIGFTKTASLGSSLFLGLRPQTQRRGHEGF